MQSNYLKFLIVFILFLLITPLQSISAASKEQTIVIEGDQYKKPGIYKWTPGKTPKLILQTPVKNLDTFTSSSLHKRFNFFHPLLEAGNNTTSFNSGKPLLTTPYGKAVTVGSKTYYTKFVFAGAYAESAYINLQKLYSVDQNGKTKKLSNDYISQESEQFFVYKNKIYYLKVNDSVEGNMDIFTMSTSGKNKKSLVENVSDFWIRSGKLYYVSSAAKSQYKLYSANLNGKNKKKVTTMSKTNLYSRLWAQHYHETAEGLIIEFEDKRGFFDYETLQPVKTLKKYIIGETLAVDLKDKKVIITGYNNDWTASTYYVANLDNSHRKKLLYGSYNFVSVDTKTNTIWYMKKGKMLSKKYK